MAAINSTLSIPSTTQWCNLSDIANDPVGTPGNGVQSLDDGHLPRWAAKVDLASVDARDLDAQLTPVTGLRQRDMPHVVLEVEVWIVDPVGHVQAAGQLGQPPTESRREVQSRVDLLEDALEGDLACRGPSSGRR